MMSRVWSIFTGLQEFDSTFYLARLWDVLLVVTCLFFPWNYLLGDVTCLEYKECLWCTHSILILPEHVKINGDDSNCITLGKWKNYRDSKKIICRRVGEKKGWICRPQRIFRTAKLFCMILQWKHPASYNYQNPQNAQHQEWNLRETADFVWIFITDNNSGVVVVIVESLCLCDSEGCMWTFGAFCSIVL